METKKPQDLHYSKDSHFSIPMQNKDMEWHFENGDVDDKKAKIGDKRIIVTPVEVTSRDKDGTRYRQTGPAQAPPPLKLPRGIQLQSKDDLRMPEPESEPALMPSTTSDHITIHVQIPMPKMPEPQSAKTEDADVSAIRSAQRGPLPTSFDTLIEKTILGSRGKRKGITLK